MDGQAAYRNITATQYSIYNDSRVARVGLDTDDYFVQAHYSHRLYSDHAKKNCNEKLK